MPGVEIRSNRAQNLKCEAIEQTTNRLVEQLQIFDRKSLVHTAAAQPHIQP